MSLSLLLIFFGLSILGIPLAVSLGLAVIVVLHMHDLPMALVPQRMYTSMNSFLLVAVPLFVLAGNLMERGGVSERIFGAANAVVGRWRGGLGQVNVVASMIFGGISGSSVADVSGLGPLEIKAMTTRGYPKPYAAALTMATSTLSSVVPPSILMIIAAATANQSVGAALAGGLGPSVVLAIGFMGLNYAISVRHGYGDVERTPFRAAAVALLTSIPAVGAPIIILGGIFVGFVTPTEAAALAVVYTLLVGSLVYREFRWRELPALLIRTGITTGTILFIAMTASVATYIFTIDGLPRRVSAWVLGISTDGLVVLLLMGVVLVMVGMFMDVIAAIFILVPVLMPTALTVGIDPIHFVVFLVLTLSIGLSTPPVGVCLFATAYVARLRLETVVRAALPFYALMVVVLVLVAAVPALTTLPVEWLIRR